MSSDKNSHFLFRWRSAIQSSGLSPTTRAVLLSLSTHMDMDGGSCWPSTKLQEEESGFRERTVCTHLIIAEKEGWIKKSKRGKTAGQAWAGNQYQATLPLHLRVKGTEGRSAPLGKGTEPNAEGAEPDDKKVLKDVQSNSSVNSSKNSDDKKLQEKSKPPPRYFDAIREMLSKT